MSTPMRRTLAAGCCARRERPRCCRAAEQRDEIASLIKKTRSHETTAKCVGLAKRPRSAKGLPFSSSRVGRRPVGNSLDHLVGAREQPAGNLEAERLGGLEIDDQLEFRGLLHDRQVGGLFTFENAAGVKSDLSVFLYQARSVTDEPARHYELTNRVHGRNRVACRKFNETLDPIVEKKITADEQRAGLRLGQAHEGGVDFAVGACFQYLNL